jgi:hypothetical protein
VYLSQCKGETFRLDPIRQVMSLGKLESSLFASRKLVVSRHYFPVRDFCDSMVVLFGHLSTSRRSSSESEPMSGVRIALKVSVIVSFSRIVSREFDLGPAVWRGNDGKRKENVFQSPR